MYLHLGNETVILKSSIVGIFDIETTSVSKITRWFLTNSENELKVTNVSNELPKSFVLCQQGEETRVYISQISTATLKRRSGFAAGASS